MKDAKKYRRKKKRFEKDSDVLVLQLPAKQEARVKLTFGKRKTIDSRH